MALGERDRWALALLGVAVVLYFGFRWATGDAPGAASTTTAAMSVPTAEKHLARARQLAASLPAREELLTQAKSDLALREAGLLQADTAAQAQALLLQTLRKLGKAQTPPLDLGNSEIGPVRPLGEDYGEALVSVTLGCRVEQLLNLMADLTAQQEIVAANDVRILSAGGKDKMLTVRLSVSGVIPRRLVPEKKGLAAF